MIRRCWRRTLSEHSIPDGLGPDVRIGRLDGTPETSALDTGLSKKLYVGNIPFTTTEDELRDVFAQHGTVDSVAVITDRETGRPRGFAFVEMADDDAAGSAMRSLDGSDLGGRSLRVNEAQERRGGGGGGGGGRGRY
jgi:RNA recognition motif-containing protein